MSTVIQPEPNSQQNPSDQQIQQNTQTPESQTPPQNPPAPSTTNPTNGLNDLNLLAYRESERERQRLQNELNQLQGRLNNEQRPTDYSTYNDRFLTEPAVATAEITRGIVQDEIRKAFAPLQQDFVTMRRQTAYRELKDQARLAYPAFSQVEADVDVIMANAEPTAQNLQAAITMAIGNRAMRNEWNPNGAGNPNPNPAPNNTANANPALVPAQVQPSPPAPPRPVNNQPVQLNELQKRIARENGMTDEQFIAWMNMDEKQVAVADLGRPKQ